jgi:predicted nucleotidyltransferase component of viral defense system
MSKAIEQSVKEKLKLIEKESGIKFNRLLDTLFLERILVRISKSKYKKKLIFKGGMCLNQFLELGRGTKDIDFLLRELTSNEKNLRAVFDEIVGLDVKDGFQFEPVEVSQLSLENKKYPGFRLTILGYLGQVKNKSTIDIGVGDVVRASLLDIELMKGKKPFFEESVELHAYPPEYIFSEKYEAIIYFDEINGRMKDYYDCFKLIEKNILNAPELKQAISDTFTTRGTELGPIPNEVVSALRTRWDNFLSKEKISKIEFQNVVERINDFLKKQNAL